MRKPFFLFQLLITIASSHGQEIKTIQLKRLNSDSQEFVFQTGQKFELSFDDLQNSNRDYQYKIEQMTYDWKPSKINSNQYVKGFNQDYITNIRNSFNTLQNYTHYSVIIPNENTQIKKTGNYIISILDENDEVVFKRKFVIYKNLVDTGVATAPTRISEAMNTEQNVKIVVNHKKFRINNPQQELKIAIIQNSNWKTTQFNYKPQIMRNNQVIYSYINKNNYKGGNNFRNFDNKTIRNTSISIANTEMKDIYHNYLHMDKPRRNEPYMYNPDANGQYVIRTTEGNNPNDQADYAMIHFKLNEVELGNKDIYVIGRFNNYEPSNDYKMHYKKDHYTAKIKLKQGFYDYQYATVQEKEGNKIVDTTEIDGSFYETDNEYLVIVYYQALGGQYDQVIGIGKGYVKN